VRTYAALGGAAARAQLVLDALEEVAGQVRLVPEELKVIGEAIGEIVPGLTPQESIDKLDTAIDGMTTADSWPAFLASLQPVNDQ